MNRKKKSHLIQFPKRNFFNWSIAKEDFENLFIMKKALGEKLLVAEDLKMDDLRGLEPYVVRQKVLHDVLLFLQALMDLEKKKLKMAHIESYFLDLKKFFYRLVELLWENVVKELCHLHSAQSQELDVTISPSDVRYLNLVAHLMLYARESQQHLQFQKNKGQKFSEQVQDISLQLVKGFPYAQHRQTGDGNKAEEPECQELNLETCYLDAIYFLDSNDETLENKKQMVYDYLTRFCVSNVTSDKCIWLILKMNKIFMESMHVIFAFKNICRNRLYEILETYVNFNKRQHFKLLYSFFMEYSLEDNSHYEIKPEDMVIWFRAVFNELVLMAESETDEDFLNYFKQLYQKKYPKFLKVFSKVEHNNICKLLKHMDEDFQTLIIHIINDLDNIPQDLLVELSDWISQKDAIASKMCITLINQLHTRFSNSGMSREEKIMFVKLLLNVACDTRSFKVPLVNLNEDVDVLFDILGKTKYRIYITKQWETHQDIYEACLNCLLEYCEGGFVAQGMLEFAPTFFHTDFDFIPVHAVLAFLHIQQKFGYHHQDQNVITLSYNLIFSSLMYISVITYSFVPNEGNIYNVPELQNALVASLKPHEIKCLLQANEKTFDHSCEKVIFHALRIITLLKVNYEISWEDPFMLSLYSRLGFKSQESTLLSKIWREICNT